MAFLLGKNFDHWNFCFSWNFKTCGCVAIIPRCSEKHKPSGVKGNPHPLTPTQTFGLERPIRTIRCCEKKSQGWDDISTVWFNGITVTVVMPTARFRARSVLGSTSRVYHISLFDYIFNSHLVAQSKSAVGPKPQGVLSCDGNQFELMNWSLYDDFRKQFNWWTEVSLSEDSVTWSFQFDGGSTVKALNPVATLMVEALWKH